MPRMSVNKNCNLIGAVTIVEVTQVLAMNVINPHALRSKRCFILTLSNYTVYRLNSLKVELFRFLFCLISLQCHYSVRSAFLSGFVNQANLRCVLSVKKLVANFSCQSLLLSTIAYLMII